MRDGEGLFEAEPVEKKRPQARAAAVDKRFRAFDPHQVLLLPPSLDDWLPEDHLARFVADLVDQSLDLSPILAGYTEKRGYPPYHPRLMVRLLIYGYTTGVRSSRAIQRKCVDDVAFRFLAADQAPDFRSIARFRRRHLDALADLFLRSLHLAQKLGMVTRRNGSRPRSPSWRPRQGPCWPTPRPPIRPRTSTSASTARTPTCPPNWTAARSASPGCRPPALRSRPRLPTRPAAMPRTRNAAARHVQAAATSRPSPTPARRPPRRPARSRRPRPTSPTPTRGS
ncbi:transposase [Streptomyces syringium]|uniref:Transposase n=1 Tax=Streptomyces syringium TaxID=76729 RepID=A0ABS4YAZ4_9ACTN|nr:transposase [Streptomyces syringium]